MTKVVLAVVARGATVSAHRRLQEALASFLPSVAILEQGTFAADLRGTRRLLGAPERVAEGALARGRALGLTPSAGVASAPFIAHRLALAAPEGACRVLRAEEERAFLAALPLEALPLDPDLRDELRLLGIRRAGDFVALPRASVFDRFGRGVAHVHALASGEDADLFARVPPHERLTSRARYESAIESLEPLLFALRAAVDALAASLRERGLAALKLGVRLEREDEPALRFERVVLPPTDAPSALLRSLRWALEERGQAPTRLAGGAEQGRSGSKGQSRWGGNLGRVAGVALEALAVEPLRGRQLGLFAPDGARREDALAVAAHLRSRLGPGRVLRTRVAAAARLPERRSRFEEAAS